MLSNSQEEKITQIKHNLEDVNSRIERAAEKSGRTAEDVKLVAVTKMMPLEIIEAGVKAGLRCFGENYAEQAAEKILHLKTDAEIEWHMIGHIQSRKTNTVCDYFDMVHSVDRMKIARYLDRYSHEAEKVMPVLIEVNLTGEDSKYGWQAANEDRWPELVTQFWKIAEYQNIEIRGLMTMPPLFDDPNQTRPIYQQLKRLQQYLQQELADVSWDELSIGTSFDYEVAVEQGATMVRLGTTIFGSRPNA